MVKGIINSSDFVNNISPKRLRLGKFISFFHQIVPKNIIGNSTDRQIQPIHNVYPGDCSTVLFIAPLSPFPKLLHVFIIWTDPLLFKVKVLMKMSTVEWKQFTFQMFCLRKEKDSHFFQ